MLTSFTRNYKDNSTEAGFQFTFFCDLCQDGYRSSFIESETYKRGRIFHWILQILRAIGGFWGGRWNRFTRGATSVGEMLSERFEERSPEWQKEHEQAFERAKNEALPHFHRCPGDSKYVCDQCWNEEEGLCTKCAPRQNILVAQTRAKALEHNIKEAGRRATVWEGRIESQTTICPQCGKPAGGGKFCNNCGFSLALRPCPRCQTPNAQGVRFCNNCGSPLEAPAKEARDCPQCGAANGPGTKFCGSCGQKLA